MRWLGGLVVLAYAASALTGVPNLGRSSSGGGREVVDRAVRGPGGTWIWAGGYSGGK